MPHTDRFPRRHPLCTCPELTFANLDAVDRSACQGGATAHPVLDTVDVASIVADARQRYAAEAGYSEEELSALVDVIGSARERGISAGGWSLARAILDAGWRRAEASAQTTFIGPTT